jgi:putative protein kinase ArgK-like GTPase of G3E family
MFYKKIYGLQHKREMGYRKQLSKIPKGMILGGHVVGKAQEAFVKEMQAKLERKIKDNEIEVIEYWQGHLARVLAMKPEGIASLQMQIKKVHDMMANRIQILKRG